MSLSARNFSLKDCVFLRPIVSVITVMTLGIFAWKNSLKFEKKYFSAYCFTERAICGGSAIAAAIAPILK